MPKNETPSAWELRLPTALVLVAVIAGATCAYVFVPDHRAEWLLAAAVGGPVLLAVMRRLVGLAPLVALVLAIAIPVPGCTPAQKAAFEAAALSALELAAKAGTRLLLTEVERALKFGDDSGGEAP